MMDPPEGAAPAPPAATTCGDGHERTLKQHVFIFPSQVATSLVTSYVGLRVRLGTETASNIPTASGRADIDLVTLAEGVDVGIKITDWLGLFVTGGFRSLVGTNLRALTYGGATYDLGGRGGVVARLFRSERTGSQLSLRAGGSYTRGQVSTLYPIFDQPVVSALEALQGDLGSSIKTPFTTSGFDGALAFTQGINAWLGVQAAAGLGRGTSNLEPYDRSRRTRDSVTNSEVTYTLGVAPSVDFNAFRVPIAVMPEYVVARQASTAQVRGGGTFDTAHTIALGVYYSGRINLQLGVIVATQLGARGLQSPVGGQSDSPSRNSGEFILRYVW